MIEENELVKDESKLSNVRIELAALESVRREIVSVAQPNQAVRILVEISPGELMDKISILELKLDLMKDESKLSNVRIELAALESVWTRDASARSGGWSVQHRVSKLVAQLAAVNRRLWHIEDDIRDCEQAKQFGQLFVNLARSVYMVNDERSALKREINELLGSKLIEEKSYSDYKKSE